jgi:translocation and assembly module TamB
MKIRWYWLKTTLLSFLMLLLVMLAIAGTHLSLQLTRWLLPQFVTGVSIGTISGDLWRGAVVEQLTYQQDNLNISIGRLETRLDWRCLSSRIICLDYLHLSGTRLNMLPPQEANNEAIVSANKVPGSFTAAPARPWALNITELSSRDFSFNVPNLQGNITLLQSGGRFAEQQLTLSATEIQGMRFVSQAEAPNDDAAFRMPDLSTLTLPVNIDLSAVKISDVQVRQARQPATTEATKKDAPRTLHLARLQLSASLQQSRWQLQLSELVATSPALRATATLDIQRDTVNTLQAEVQAELPELLPNQQLQGTLQGPLEKIQVQLQLKGAQQADIAATVDLSQPQLPFQLTLKADALHWPLGDSASATYHASAILLDVAGSLDQQQLSGGLKATLPNFPNSTVSFRAHYQHPSKQFLLENLQIDTLNGHANISGSYDLKQQQLTSHWQLHQIQPGLYWTDYAGELSGDFNLATTLKPNLSIDINNLNIIGTLRDFPLRLTGAATASQQTDHWRVNTQQLLLSHGPNQLTISGGLEQQWQLAVQLNISDLAASLSQSEGQITGDIRITGPAAHPDLAIQLNGSNLNYQDDYALTHLELKAKIADWGTKASTLSLTAKQGQAPSLQLQQLDWQLSGNRQQHDSHFILDSHQLQAALAMQGQLQSDRWQAQWQELRLKSDVGDWQLQQPTASTWALGKQQLSLAAFCLKDNAATLCVEALQQASLKTGQLRFNLTAFELSALSALLPDAQSLSGQVAGNIQVGWRQGERPTAAIKLGGGAGKLEYQSSSLLEIPWQQLSLDASLTPQQLQASLQLDLPTALQAPAQQLGIQLGLRDLYTSDKQLDARLRFQQFDLAFLQPLFSEFSQFSAKLNGDVSASGSLNNPLLQGQIILDQLSLNGRQAPMEIADSRLTLAFADRKASLSGALLTPEGPLDISGDANWQVPNAWFGRVQLAGQQLKLHLPNASFSFSPDLLFSAEPQGGLLSGEVLLENGKMEVDALPENAIRVSDDEVIRTAAIVDRSGLPPWKLSSDIRLTLGENVRLAAFGLKTKLQGVLRIRQQGLVPTIHGQVALREGTFRAYGQDLELRKGKLTFNGPADQPLMAIEAIRNPEKTEDNVIAGIQVDGLTDNPVIKVFSNPAKPQANALAYLLLGRDLTSSSSDKSVTTSLIGLGIASSGKLVGQLGEVFGLRELSLDTAGSGDTSKVMVSGYLSPKLQLKYGVGIFNQVGEFTLRYRLARKLFLEAVRGVDESVDLLYQVEFD